MGALATPWIAWADPGCVTIPVETWMVEDRAFFHASAYRVYWLMTGDDPSGGRMQVDPSTGSFCVEDPAQPVDATVTPGRVRRMTEATLAHRDAVAAQRERDKTERRRLQDELVADEAAWDTMTPAQQRQVDRKRLRLENLERGALGQSVPWVDPDLTSP